MTSSTPVLSPAIPQLPIGDLQRTAEFYRERLGFTGFTLRSERGHLIVRREQVEVHFWHAGSEEAAVKYGSAA